MDLKTSTRRHTASRGIVAIIEREGRILMQKRREHIADPGTWVLPGGEVQRGETASETLVRVCGEELGISVRPSKEIGTLKLEAGELPAWRVLWHGEELKLSHENVTGIGWFTLEELEVLQPVRHEAEFRNFLKDHAEKLAEESPAPDQTVEDMSEEEKAAELDRKRLVDLVRKAQGGDHLAFGNLYDLFITPIYRYVAFRVPQGIAEDLTADIFVKAWEKLDSYAERKGTPFSSWLFRIARNIVIDSYRMQRESEELDEFHEDEDRWNDPSLAITQELESRLLRQAMAKLPKRYREILLLAYMADLSHAEIAHAMKVREGGVRILKHRALKKLSSLLPASMREEVP